MFTSPLLWFTVRTRTRHLWRILLSTPTVTPTITSLACEGYTDEVRLQVVLDIRYPWQRIASKTMPHELAHVAASEREIEDHEQEELMVRTIATPLFDILSRTPFKMHVPPRPVEYARFRRWALKVDPFD